MQEARPGAVLGDFGGARFTDGRITSTFFRRDDRFFVRTDGPDGTLQDFEITYTYGVEPLQQYLIELPGGRVQPLSIAWDSRPASEGGQRWFHLYAGQGVDHSDELHWTSRRQNWNFMCADCHSTNVKKGYDAQADRFQTTWSEIDVGCEACHGPGSRHVEWANASAVWRSLVWSDNGLPAQLTEREGTSWTIGADGRPGRSAPRTTNVEIEVCAQCHSRRAQIADGYTAGAPFHDFYVLEPVIEGLYHPDGQQLDEVYVHGSFLQSRMYREGVTCSDCHDPHSQQVRAPGNRLCVRCHDAASYDTPLHHAHAEASEGSRCVACHMPEATYMVIDPRRDHAFQVPRPDRTVTLDVPNACTGCHTDRPPQWAADALRGRLGRDAAGFQRFAEAFSAADQTAQGASAALRQIAGDASSASVVRASALARLRDEADAYAIDAARAGLADPDPIVRWWALVVLEQLQPSERTVAAPLLADPLRAIRIQAASVLAPAATLLAGAAREAFEGASEEFIASQQYNADRPENRLALGSFFAQLGRGEEAEAEYRAALRLSPRYGPAYVNLADLVRRQGREAEAQRTLREGLGVSPDDPALHHALGLSLVRSRDVAAAIEALARAAALAPERPEFAYSYAVALNRAGRTRDAIQALERARVRHPGDRDLLFTLATFHRDAGETDAAIRYARLLSELSDPRGQALLQSLQ